MDDAQHEHEEITACSEADAVIAEMNTALRTLVKPEPADLPIRFVAVDRVVMQGQVFICRAPSHKKAHKLAQILNQWQEREAQK